MDRPVDDAYLTGLEAELECKSLAALRRSVVPTLVAEVRRLQEENQELRDRILSFIPEEQCE